MTPRKVVIRRKLENGEYSKFEFPGELVEERHRYLVIQNENGGCDFVEPSNVQFLDDEPTSYPDFVIEHSL